jgi:ribosome-binding protein aMBF1 (putative translation factor)
MVTVREVIGKDSCGVCQDHIRRTIHIELPGLVMDWCPRCAEDIRLQLTRVLHAGRAPRRRKPAPKSQETPEEWRDST